MNASFRHCATRLTFGLMIYSLHLVAIHAADPTFTAGFSERDISPTAGMEQPGGYGKSYHQTQHDPCKVRAAVFADGTTTVAVVGIDALIIRTPTVKKCRELIEAKTGIPAANVLIAASHTHSGGPTGLILPGEFDHADDFTKQLAYEKSSCADANYLAHVEQAIVEAVAQAHAQLQPAMGNAGFGSTPGVAFNRRFRMRSGGTMTHPGQGNPDIVEPAGPVDPQVGVLGIWNEQRKLQGCVVNFACHATTGPGGSSADYVYYVEKAIRGYFGNDVIVVFLAGFAGDVTQVDNQSPLAIKQFGESSSAKVGGTVGAEAIKVLLAMDPHGPLTPVAVATRTHSIKRRAPSAQRLSDAKALAADAEQAKLNATDWTFAKELVLLDALITQSPTVEVETQVVQVGPVAFCTSPAEYFCQYGLDVKRASKFPYTFPVSLANGCVGYVPTTGAFSPHGGGYETRLSSYSNLEITAGDTIAKSLIELTDSLTPTPPPTPKPLPPFTGEPWTYGRVPPELE
jgi:hypothetical protein